MLCIDSLKQLELFKILPEARLQWICDRTTHHPLKSGDLIVRQDQAASGFFILITGKTTITRTSEGIEIPLGQHEAPAFFGEIQVLTEEPVPVSMQALGDCDLYELSATDFLELLHSCRDFERKIFQTVASRLRGLESFIRGREKMAALGTFSAGLAHELNNPAAALVRGFKEMLPAMIELQRMNLVYGQRQVDNAHTQAWLDLRDQGFDHILNKTLDPISRSDREEALLDWLEDYGVEDSWNLVEPLAAGGVTVAQIDALITRWRDDPTELRDMGIRWLALSLDVMSMITHGLQGAERISELVQAMKSYAYLDQGAKQIVDIHQGLEDTLKLLNHRLKYGIVVKKNYDCSLPKIEAFGSELNQVWTNLIENAIDAMEAAQVDQPTLTLTTQLQGDHIQVEISDNGPGIPEGLRSRIYEPFFTTKPVGKGTGLGLEVVRRIVENRHRGSILLASKPGKTTFCICLPTN